MADRPINPAPLPHLRPQTRLVHAGHVRSQFDETTEAIFQTSGYVYGSAEEAEAAFIDDSKRYVYARFRNPTVRAFEERLSELEGATRCYATASGMAAVYAALAANLAAGDRLVAARGLFGSCYIIAADILPRFGIETEFVDGTDNEAWTRALSRPAKAVFFETPGNPTTDLVDIAHVVKLARAAGAVSILDNALASPIVQPGFEHAPDLVVYSATKHIDGQGRSLAGAILVGEGATAQAASDRIAPFLRHTGPALSAFNAWLLTKSLETLGMRVTAMAANADRLAQHLEAARGRGIARVFYPGLTSHPQHALAQRQMRSGGTIMAFEVEGGREGAFAFANALQVVRISNNLGDSKSLITHPFTSTHKSLAPEVKDQMGITQGLLRLSVGLEDGADLIDDLDRGLAALGKR